jgi:ubiquinone/menaquinone biosynthesis C-methylase UbiE
MNVDILRCPFCYSTIAKTYGNTDYGIFSCGKHKFPLVKGILYMLNDNKAQIAIMFIKKGEYKKAVAVLVNLPRHIAIPALLILHQKHSIPFSYYIFVLKLLGYGSSWLKYHRNRSKSNSYKITSYLRRLLIRGNTLDFGCGVGQLLPGISNVVGAKHLYAVDNFFFNLLIARKYFAKRNSTLICSNSDSSLPFADSSFSNIIATDSFHYVTSKVDMLKKMHNVLSDTCCLFLIQIINSRGVVFENIHGICPPKLYKIMKKVGFKKITIFANNNFIKLWHSKNVGFIGNYVENIKHNDEYSALATK